LDEKGPSSDEKITRITADPAVCDGKPCIRGLRFPVAQLLGLVAAGETREAILKDYPYLQSGDIDEALRYAALLAEDERFELQPFSGKNAAGVRTLITTG